MCRPPRAAASLSECVKIFSTLLDSQYTHKWEGLLIYPEENGNPEKGSTPEWSRRDVKHLYSDGAVVRGSWALPGPAKLRACADTDVGMVGTQLLLGESQASSGVLEHQWTLSQGDK